MRKGCARRHFFMMFALVIALIVLFALSSLLLPFDPNATDLTRSLRSPGEAGFLLGSDTLGRDVLV